MSAHQGRLSSAGVDFIARFEGFVPKPYNDADRPPNATIGFGHMLHHGPVTHQDEQHYAGGISRDRALDLLKKDAASCVAAVNESVRVPLNQAQFDALVSFAFNVGVGALEGSTLLKDINSGHTVANLHSSDDGERHAAQNAIRSAFLAWDHGNGGVVLAGLQRRRTEEAHLFMTGDYGS